MVRPMIDLYSDLEATLRELPDVTEQSVRKGIERLRQAGVVSVKGLKEVVESAGAERELQAAACDVLGRLSHGLRETTFPLAELMERSDDPLVIWEAAKALAMMDARDAATTVVPLLTSENRERATAAAWVLGSTRCVEAVDDLRAIVRRTSVETEVRGQAAEALGLLQSREAVQDLIDALEDRAAEVRYWAAYALGRIRDRRALPALEELARTDQRPIELGTVASEAREAIDSILSPEAGSESSGD